MAKRFTKIDDLVVAIQNQFDEDMGEFTADIMHFARSEVKASVVSSLHISYDPRLSKSKTQPFAGDIASAIVPAVESSSGGMMRFKMWHVPSLESVSTPKDGGKNIPIWSMLNWGSGPNVQFSSYKRAEWSVSKRFIYNLMNYVLPLKTKSRDISRRTSVPPFDVGGEFVWWKKSNRGARGQGFYVPVRTVAKINAARAKRRDKEGVKVEPMKYYTAQHYIEKSVSQLLGHIRQVLGSCKGIAPKHPIR